MRTGQRRSVRPIGAPPCCASDPTTSQEICRREIYLAATKIFRAHTRWSPKNNFAPHFASKSSPSERGKGKFVLRPISLFVSSVWLPSVGPPADQRLPIAGACKRPERKASVFGRARRRRQCSINHLPLAQGATTTERRRLVGRPLVLIAANNCALNSAAASDGRFEGAASLGGCACASG